MWSESGEIILQGRTDDQVKVRGNRVEPGEVSFLIEACEGVKQAFVLAAEDHAGKTMLAAFSGPGFGSRSGHGHQLEPGKFAGLYDAILLASIACHAGYCHREN